jgi:hypothetical protein
VLALRGKVLIDFQILFFLGHICFQSNGGVIVATTLLLFMIGLHRLINYCQPHRHGRNNSPRVSGGGARDHII